MGDSSVIRAEEHVTSASRGKLMYKAAVRVNEAQRLVSVAQD